jgi:hypothetical protein
VLRGIDLKPIKVTPESCGSATEFDELLSQGLVFDEKFMAEDLRRKIMAFLAVEKRKYHAEQSTDEELLASFKVLLEDIKPRILRCREIRQLLDMSRETLRDNSSESPLTVQLEYVIRRSLLEELDHNSSSIAMLVDNLIYNHRLY